MFPNLTINKVSYPCLFSGVTETVDDQFGRATLVEVRRVKDFRVIQ